MEELKQEAYREVYGSSAGLDDLMGNEQYDSDDEDDDRMCVRFHDLTPAWYRLCVSLALRSGDCGIHFPACFPQEWQRLQWQRWRRGSAQAWICQIVAVGCIRHKSSQQVNVDGIHESIVVTPHSTHDLQLCSPSGVPS
jgi:hypothetical protein